MLNIKRFVVNMIGENCYIVSDETKDAIIIDDGALYPEEHQAIDNYIKVEQLSIKHSIYTHAHFDHLLGCTYLNEKYNLKPELNENDIYLYNNLPEQITQILGYSGIKAPSISEMPEIVQKLKEGDEISFGNHKLSVIETPGHTPGGICFYCKSESILFSGDTIFKHSIGRTDLPQGNYGGLINSLRNKIMTLPNSTVICPGHGDSTSIAEEKIYNPYI